MNEELPDWSLFGFLDKGGKFVGEMVGTQKDGIGQFAAWCVGVAIVACVAPIFWGLFILSHRFRVSGKTWFYGIAMLAIAIFIGIIALFQMLTK
jgi:hypothetical protein